MQRKVRDLDFDAIVAQIESATNPGRRTVTDRLMQADLGFVQSTADAVMMVRNHIVLTVLDRTKAIDDIPVDGPLIEAFVRTQHHPAARSIPQFKVQEGLYGPDSAPRLGELADAHPEWTWDIDAVQALLVRAIREPYGDHEVNADAMPWAMHWGPALGAFRTLLAFVTLRALGDL